MLEQPLVQDILREIGARPDVRLWRNNVGAAVVNGESQATRRFVRFGLVGSADITGVLANGRRVEIEVKRPDGKGRRSAAQVAFAAMAQRFGALYVLAESVDDVEVAVNLALYGTKARPA